MRINNFFDIFKETGWVYKLNLEKFIENNVIYSILGLINRGKTHLANELCGVALQKGFHIHTESLSLIYSKEKNSSIACLDSPGLSLPLNYSENDQGTQLLDRFITDDFLKKFLIYNSTTLIVVVGVLSKTEQKLINTLVKTYPERTIYVIHNLFEMDHEKLIREKIKDDILYSFDVLPRRFPTSEKNMFPFFF